MEPVLRDVRTRRFWVRLITQGFACFGALAVVGGVIDLFSPALLAGQGWLGWTALAFSVVFGLIRAWPQPVQATYQAPATAIRLVRGNLFEQPGSHLVIGVSDTFDTAAPHIAPDSVQGKFLQDVYGADVQKLDDDIARELAAIVPVGTIAGKGGKVERYPLGTVVVLKSNSIRYFLVAYTQMDVRSMASSTTDGLWNSLSELWRSVRSESNGGRVSIPLVGGGQSKLSPLLPAVDSVRFIALSFMLASRASRVCSELAVVVPPKQYDELDHLEIQAFLDSLRPS